MILLQNMKPNTANINIEELAGVLVQISVLSLHFEW